MEVTTQKRKDGLLQPEGFAVNKFSLFVSTMAINILSLSLPVMTLQVYDRIIPNPGSGTLPILIAGVCCAILLEAALRLTRSYVLGWSGAAYEHRLACDAIKHALQADLSHLSTTGIGENLNRISAIGKLKDFYSGYALTTLYELIFVPIFLGVIIYIAGPLAVVPTVVMITFAITAILQGRNLRAALKARDDSDDKRYNFLIESLEGVHSLKAFALENNFSRRYETLEESSSLTNFRVTEATSGTFNAGTVFSHLMVAFITAIGALLALKGNITTGALVATVLLAGRMMQPVQRALALWAKYQDFILARNKVETLFSLPQHPANVSKALDPEKQGTLALHDLSFRVHENKPWLLDKINLGLNHGESLLLSADCDESKAALLELIAGIYSANHGQVVIDGHDIYNLPPEKLINHVGYIATEGLIFRGTIRDNMTCFGQIPDRQVQEMAALLRVNRDIARLPAGFDTFLNGTSADNIPPGLKQKIAMVRVLAPRPRIILFDNADKALDHEGYHLVYNLLTRLKGVATMILISEDQNIRALADRVCVIEDGRLLEKEKASGTNHVHSYEELRL